MSDRIVADLLVLERAVNEFQGVLQAVRQVLADLDRQMQTPLAIWDGEAAHAYRSAHGQWKTAANDMAERLSSLHKTLRMTHGNYRISLEANVAMWDIV